MTLADWIEAHGETAQYAVFFGLLLVLIVAERVSPFRTRTDADPRRWLANYGLTVVNILALGALPTSFVALAAGAAEHGVGLLNSVALPPPVVVAVNLLLRGLISYVTHLLMHKVPLLWRVHRVHHLDTELDVSTTVRFHPLEFPIGLAIGAPFVIALGLSPWVLLLYEILDVAVTLWSHSNLATPRWLERALRLIVVTPELHRVHHSTHPDETDTNFSAVFPIWDLVFGTFRTTTREDPKTMRLGLDEVRDARTRRFGWLLAVPFLGTLHARPLDGGPAREPATPDAEQP